MENKDFEKILIQTFDGKKTLQYLVENVGVKNKVKYYNIITKKEKLVKKYFDYGFIFNDGFEIRHVLKKHFSAIDSEIIEKRERVPQEIIEQQKLF